MKGVSLVLDSTGTEFEKESVIRDPDSLAGVASRQVKLPGRVHRYGVGGQDAGRYTGPRQLGRRGLQAGAEEKVENGGYCGLGGYGGYAEQVGVFEVVEKESVTRDLDSLAGAASRQVKLPGRVHRYGVGVQMRPGWRLD